MSELTSLFGIISEGKKQAEIEKAERIRIEEDRRQRLEPQVEVELYDLSEFFSVMSTKKKMDSLPKETKQEVEQLQVLSSFFEQMSKFETSLDSAIQASEKEPEVVEKIVEVPVEKVVEKEVIVEDFLATVFQHELDHLFGFLYVDRLNSTRDLVFEEELNNIASEKLLD